MALVRNQKGWIYPTKLCAKPHPIICLMVEAQTTSNHLPDGRRMGFMPLPMPGLNLQKNLVHISLCWERNGIHQPTSPCKESSWTFVWKIQEEQSAGSTIRLGRPVIWWEIQRACWAPTIEDNPSSTPHPSTEVVWGANKTIFDRGGWWLLYACSSQFPWIYGSCKEKYSFIWILQKMTACQINDQLKPNHSRLCLSASLWKKKKKTLFFWWAVVIHSGTLLSSGKCYKAHSRNQKNFYSK